MICPECFDAGTPQDMDRIGTSGGFDHYECPKCGLRDEAPAEQPCRCVGSLCVC